MRRAAPDDRGRARSRRRDRPPLREPLPGHGVAPRARLADPPGGGGAHPHHLRPLVGAASPPLPHRRLQRRVPDLLQLPLGRHPQCPERALRLADHDRAVRPIRTAPRLAPPARRLRHGARPDPRRDDRPPRRGPGLARRELGHPPDRARVRRQRPREAPPHAVPRGLVGHGTVARLGALPPHARPLLPRLRAVHAPPRPRLRRAHGPPRPRPYPDLPERRSRAGRLADGPQLSGTFERATGSNRTSRRASRRGGIRRASLPRSAALGARAGRSLRRPPGARLPRRPRSAALPLGLRGGRARRRSLRPGPPARARGPVRGRRERKYAERGAARAHRVLRGVPGRGRLRDRARAGPSAPPLPGHGLRDDAGARVQPPLELEQPSLPLRHPPSLSSRAPGRPGPPARTRRRTASPRRLVRGRRWP